MIDLGFLQTPLAPPVTISESELHSALDQVATLAERSQFVQAGQTAAQLWRSRIYDIRTLGILLYSDFSENGMGALERIFAAAKCVLTEHWSCVGPTPTKERHVDGALRWLSTSIISQFRFAQKLSPTDWQKLLQEWDTSDQQATFLSLMRLMATLESVPSTGQAKASLSQLHKTLRELPTTHPERPADKKTTGPLPPDRPGLPRDSGAAPNESIGSEFATMKPQDQNAEAVGLSAAGQSPTAVLSGTTTQPTLVIPLSPPMFALMQKLGAFNRLVRLGRFKQAAIVYKDIKETIEKFDPRQYLPAVFGEYFSNIVLHADKLLPSMDSKDDFAHRALVDLYQIDLERFIQATC